MNRQDLLLEKALELGFDVAGWAVATTPPEATTRYQQWLEKGFHAGMDYLERQLVRRNDLTTTLSGARSVLVLGISHAFPDLEVPAGGVRVGRVARYAWTPDYHGQIEPLLRDLEETATQLGVRSRGCVDYAPIMERELSSRAFLGWQGKSGMMISQKLGAFVTLAVLLTDLEMEEQGRHVDRCGRCQACVNACPTSAIQEGRVIDSRRCISYLTIEHRGPIPQEFRSGMGSWLFGCDHCLEVCPWSIKAGAVSRNLIPNPELAHPDLSVFFEGSNRDFDRRFAHTAFSRPRRKGMARNALMVLGNLRDPLHLALVLKGAQDEAWEVRASAAWALGQFEEKQSLSAIENLLQDPQEEVRQEASRQLAKI
ncbi:tRNA epoxyqueuosine(34) reductase QueG [Deinococcus cellulosilyticus]|uniref:Epoxyqueuosine reductase n=1 Tax=Deinococcus cellulosilyticus (strain DSM 18568 / NBRC 106333 / KACC 11606 / 5516J-15) TaxID=1223518 RepID=A0A511MWX9_DEIC1|nr:tRNA epoxyqueuosine(34) reductase QueG [Deinococcus cellulosilyticus]GEM45082.1 epoxyqueuosine reductase [Deinococcus cellulosilyticus NBRC 106333 = KACC 11606]